MERAFGGEPTGRPWTGGERRWKPGPQLVDEGPLIVDERGKSVDEEPATLATPRNYILW
jgi:hypothetical protein